MVKKKRIMKGRHLCRFGIWGSTPDPKNDEDNTIMNRRSSGDKVMVQSKTKSLKERPMSDIKYIGMDVHMAMTVIAVRNRAGNVIAEAIVETKAETIVDFIKSQRGTVYVTFEEGTQAAWLYDLLCPHVTQVIVCDPRKIPGKNNKSDKRDAQDLAELLRIDALKSVYHGESSTRELKELVRSYAAFLTDGTRVKNRIKSLFRARGVRCRGISVYSEKDRQLWLEKLENFAVRKRLLRLWKELDFLTELREEAEKDVIAEARKHKQTKLLKGIPGIGPKRAGVIVAIAATPHRFRTRKQFWTYCGLAVRSDASAEYELVDGRIGKSKKRVLVRGLNRNYNRALKEAFKGAAATAATGPWKAQFDAIVANGTDSSLAILTLARKIASITLALWKKGERYDEKKLNFLHAV
jgi:transposase